MPTYNIERRINKLKGTISGLKYKYQIQKACLDEIAALREKGYATTTIRGYLTSYRKEIIGGKKSKKYTHWVTDYLKISTSEQEKIKSDYAKKIAIQTGERGGKSASSLAQKLLKGTKQPQKASIKHTVRNLIAMIEGSKVLLKSDSYIDVGIGLMMLTGRRNVEIFKTATFEKVNDLTVKFKGQLKTKSNKTVSYEIITLCKSDLVINGLKRLRKMRDFTELTHTQVNKRTGKSSGKRVKNQMGELFGNTNMKPYDLRAIYAQTIFQLVHESEGVSNTASYARSLGHIFEVIGKEGKKVTINQITSKSYDKFLIKPSDIVRLRAIMSNT